MSVTMFLYQIQRILKPDEYVTERTRRKYEDTVYNLPIAIKFDPRKSKYRNPTR